MDEHYAQKILEKVRQNYDLISEEFDRTRQKIWPEFNLFLPYLRDGLKILDIGCGNGRLLHLIKDFEVEYLGIDFSKGLISKAQEYYNQNKNNIKAHVKFQVSNFFHFRENTSFDQIYAIAVLHQIPSFNLRQKFCQKVYSLLKKNGLFLVIVWNLWQIKFWPYHFKYTFLKIIGKSRLDFKDIFIPWKTSQGQVQTLRYYHAFTLKELKRLFERSNFKIKWKGYVPNPHILKARNLMFILEK